MIFSQVAENIKEFFHNEGIHSTTIQPEFVDFHQQPADGNGNEDCVLSCSKVVEKDCEALKCCNKDKVEATNSNGSSNSSSGHNLKRSSRSAQNTPTSARRPTSFTEKEVQASSNNFTKISSNSMTSLNQHSGLKFENSLIQSRYLFKSSRPIFALLAKIIGFFFEKKF